MFSSLEVNIGCPKAVRQIVKLNSKQGVISVKFIHAREKYIESGISLLLFLVLETNVTDRWCHIVLHCENALTF